MAIKNTKLGGNDFATPTARVKPTDLNDTFDAAANFIDVAGWQFKNIAQLLYNSARIGWNANLNVSGAPNLKNVIIHAGQQADTVYGFNWDGSTGSYFLPNFSAVTYYVIIEASSGPSSSGNIVQVSSGKWLIYDSTLNASQEVQRAKVWAELLSSGTLGSFTGVTAIKVSDANDVGFRGFRVSLSYDFDHYPHGASVTGTFANTTTNVVSSWSNVYNHVSTSGYTNYTDWSVPSGTSLNSVTNSSSDEIGTDKQADEKSNPATCVLTGSGGDDDGNGTAIILCKGAITFVFSNASHGGGASYSTTDYKTAYSLPDTSQADTLVNEGVAGGTLIYKDTVATVTDCFHTFNVTLDSGSTSTYQYSVSADGGSHWTNSNDCEMVKFANTGTALWRRIVFTRSDVSKVDKVSEEAVWYNTGVY